ncbi:MAG: ImmA/IrrE family metallo-endopeptidase [Gammaproteobacteria bacterium]|nr:ImmA/IrrE family metallo-endopeptidase [Gammaproteobacteria bacterium]
MTLRVEVEPKLLSWAIERSGVDSLVLHHRFKKLDSWLDQSFKPTLKQVEAFAKATRTPIGYLFLHEPPKEQIPIPNFRTISNVQLSQPSANLLDTIYICQQRQEWYRDYARNNGLKTLDYVGSVDRKAPIKEVAKHIRKRLGFDLGARRSMRTWEEALRSFIASADAAGIMVMCSSIVLNNTRRKLNPEEFRGFALTDNLAPLVFINGADTKSAQMFTLAHELAHLWLGETALSSADLSGQEEQAVERWCNTVVAELLVPLSVFSAELRDEDLSNALRRLARRFKVSTLVILRCMLDAEYLSSEEYSQAYTLELERLLSISGGSGGDFYLSQPNKLSKCFARALVVSTMEGQTLYRDAMRMLGVKKVSTCLCRHRG